MARQQFFEHTLQPIKISREHLLGARAQLQAAVRRGVQQIESTCPTPDPDEQTENGEAYGNMFNGQLGIGLMFLRLQQQSAYLADEHGSFLPNFWKLASKRIAPILTELSLQPGRPSPLASAPLGAAVLRILEAIPSTIPGPETAPISLRREDIAALQVAVNVALRQPHVVNRHGHDMGGDEVLYGRAGLLWALLNIRQRMLGRVPQDALRPVLETVSDLVEVILKAGKDGAQEFIKVHGQRDALPLMWPWLDDRYGLGAMHGIVGILTILLACGAEEVNGNASQGNISLIAQTITGICKVCISQNGHLDTSIPPFESSRPLPFVQICHGAPGLLLLLGLAKDKNSIVSSYREPEWDEAIKLGSDRVWEEGLLSKGGSLCHGIAGNAWPWLVLYHTFEYSPQSAGEYLESPKRYSPPSSAEDISGDDFLSKALAFLLHAQETAPFSTQDTKSENQYRMPDHPYSLFEGLAGTICAWTEACVVITARLRKMELDVEGRVEDDGLLKQHLSYELGMPGLGGRGARGLI